MTDPSPAQQIRNLMDSVHDALSIAEHPPSPKGGQGGSASASRPPMPVSILDAKLDLKAKLTSWALMVSEEAEVVITCDDNSYSIAGWIYTKADWLAGHPALDDLLGEIEECVKTLRAPYQSRADLEYCGEHQGEKIYVRRGQTTAVLPDGTVERVSSLKAWGASHMLDVIDTPKVVADIIRTFFIPDITAKKITTMHSDDNNPDRPKRARPLRPATIENGRKLYRVSDVLDRLRESTGVVEESAVS